MTETLVSVSVAELSDLRFIASAVIANARSSIKDHPSWCCDADALMLRQAEKLERQFVSLYAKYGLECHIIGEPDYVRSDKLPENDDAS